MISKDSRIAIIGHNDILENSLTGYFRANGYPHVFSFSELAIDPTVQASVNQFFSQERPDFVFLASTRSGGIGANQKFPAEFIYHNLESQNNIIHTAYKFGVKKLVLFAGSCAYPKECQQPIREDALLTGPLEPTSEPYSVAKIAGIKMCQAYKKQYGFNSIVLVPATVYGPGSDVAIETAHVIGALIGKFYDAVRNSADVVTVWGSGEPRREFLFVDDFIDACLFCVNHYDEAEILNIGCGADVSIAELAREIKAVSGFTGDIAFDKTKPDGTMKKLMDNSRVRSLGWIPKTSLVDGIKKTYQWYCECRSKEQG